MVHRLKAKVTVPTDGHEPYWETRCGLRLNEAPIGVTDNAADVSCAKCKKAR